MKSRLAVVIFVLAILAISSTYRAIQPAPSAHAQDTWTATVWLGDESSGYLHIVDGTGVLDTIQVAPTLVGPDPYTTIDVATSSDNQYIVHSGLDLVADKAFLRFGETGVDGACCTNLDDTFSDVLFFDLAGFEPDGSRFAVSYLQAAEGQDNMRHDGMLVVDAATGDVEYEIDLGLAMSVLGREDNEEWAVLGDWTDEGILFLGTCANCDSAAVGEYFIWNPDLTYIGEDSGYYRGFGDQLDITHELLLEAQDTQYYYDPSPGPLPAPNVIRYYPNGDVSESPSVVYANTDSLIVGRVRWVGDGRAFLLMNRRSDTWDIVYRDGHTSTIEGVGDIEFMSASPDGWFVLGEDSGNPALFHYDLDTLQPTFVAPASVGLVKMQVTQVPPQGAAIESPSLVALSPPDVAQTARCPGFLPSRLILNDYGQVTPGAANRMRSYASVDAEEVGSIPGGEIFLVLEGPSCDRENQIAWWRVEFEGQQGWTAEGQGDTYWTQPAQ